MFGFGWAIRDIFAIDLEVENKTATILGFMLRKVGAGALVTCTDRYCGYLLVHLIGTGQQPSSLGSSSFTSIFSSVTKGPGHEHHQSYRPL